MTAEQLVVSAGRPMTADEATGPSAPAWFRDSVTRYRALMLDDIDPYPCHFGVRGERTGVNRYTYVDGERGDVDRVAGALVAFATTQRGDPSDVKRTLVVFARHPTTRDRATQFTAFWSLLRSLHAVDPLPWPHGVPRDPDDPRWEFCFAGEPWFVIATSPAEALRRSRRIADHPVYFFQVKRIFADLGGETAAGRAAKRLIRRRLAVYDDAPAPAVLGDPAHSSASKWRQYFLPAMEPSADDSGADSCPFRYEEHR